MTTHVNAATTLPNVTGLIGLAGSVFRLDARRVRWGESYQRVAVTVPGDGNRSKTTTLPGAGSGVVEGFLYAIDPEFDKVGTGDGVGTLSVRLAAGKGFDLTIKVRRYQTDINAPADGGNPGETRVPVKFEFDIEAIASVGW